MAQAPMYLIGAKKMKSDTIRFVFMCPIDGNSNIMQGNGAVVEIEGFSDLRVGEDTPMRGSLLEAFVETMVEGDEKDEGRGPIPCGFALSGDQFQLVEYYGAGLLAKCRCDKVTYISNIDMSNFNPDEQNEVG